MRDPGYISEAAWNQEAPYRDADFYDLEQDQRWDRVAGSDFYPDDSFSRARNIAPGVAPDRADCTVSPPSTPAGAPSLAGVSSKS